MGAEPSPAGRPSGGGRVFSRPQPGGERRAQPPRGGPPPPEAPGPQRHLPHAAAHLLQDGDVLGGQPGGPALPSQQQGEGRQRPHPENKPSRLRPPAALALGHSGALREPPQQPLKDTLSPAGLAARLPALRGSATARLPLRKDLLRYSSCPSKQHIRNGTSSAACLFFIRPFLQEAQGDVGGSPLPRCILTTPM